MAYLTKEKLQQVEDRIELLHKKFREKFNVTETTLRNFQVGDYFGNQKLYFDFDILMNFNEEYEDVSIIKTDTDDNISYYARFSNEYYGRIDFNNNNIAFPIYFKADIVTDFDKFVYGNFTNRSGIITIGNSKVIEIKEDENTYKSIKIKDDRYKLLAYIKKTWVDNEFPYMQYIDNIEEGINDVAEIFYAPIGFDYKPWILKGNISNYTSIETNGLSQKTISEDDFVRWNKNIDLLEKAFNDIINIWNLISYINWNEESQFEWEDR